VVESEEAPFVPDLPQRLVHYIYASFKGKVDVRCERVQKALPLLKKWISEHAEEESVFILDPQEKASPVPDFFTNPVFFTLMKWLVDQGEIHSFRPLGVNERMVIKIHVDDYMPEEVKAEVVQGKLFDRLVVTPDIDEKIYAYRQREEVKDGDTSLPHLQKVCEKVRNSVQSQGEIFARVEALMGTFEGDTSRENYWLTLLEIEAKKRKKESSVESMRAVCQAIISHLYYFRTEGTAVSLDKYMLLTPDDYYLIPIFLDFLVSQRDIHSYRLDDDHYLLRVTEGDKVSSSTTNGEWRTKADIDAQLPFVTTNYYDRDLVIREYRKGFVTRVKNDVKIMSDVVGRFRTFRPEVSLKERSIKGTTAEVLSEYQSIIKDMELEDVLGVKIGKKKAKLYKMGKITKQELLQRIETFKAGREQYIDSLWYEDMGRIIDCIVDKKEPGEYRLPFMSFENSVDEAEYLKGIEVIKDYYFNDNNDMVIVL